MDRSALVLAGFLTAAAACAVACSHKKPSGTSSSGDAGAAEASEEAVPIQRLAEPSREGSSVVLGKLGEHSVAFVADDDTKTVRTIDLDAKHEIGSVVVGSRVGQMLLTKQGTLAIALRDDASVALLEARPGGSLRLAKKIATAAEPVGLALSPDDGTLLVATGMSHRLQGFLIADDGAAASNARTVDVEVAREPRGVAVSADGKRAFVAHAAASALEIVDLGTAPSAAAGATAATLDLGIGGGAAATTLRFRPMPPPRHMLDVVDPFMLNALIPIDESPEGSGRSSEEEFLPARFARQGYAIARATIRASNGDTEELFVIPHTEMMTGDPLTVSSGYGGGGVEGMGIDEPTERFSLSVVREEDGKRKLLSHAGDARTKDGCHLPRGAASSSQDGTIFVACFGSDSVAAFAVALKEMVIPEVKSTPAPPRKPGQPFAETPKQFAPHPEQHLAFVTTHAVGRVPVPAGPTGVALDRQGARVVSFSQLDGALAIVSLSSFAPAAAAHPALPPEIIRLARATGIPEQVARGRMLFASGGDPRISKDGRACSSCHPEGRDDGLVWSTPDGPRQTILLAGREDRKGPFGWLGKHSTLQIHMQTTMKNLKGEGLPPADQDALAAFIASMKGPAQKWRALSDEEAHGRDLFNSSDTQCNNCHASKTSFSDHDVHDVKSATFADAQKTFLVPSLVGVGTSAPYFHDGRYATLEDLLDKDNDTMGMTKQLSAADKKALAAYLRTL